MKLHGENVVIHDRVYDLVRGYGQVSKVDTGMFEVDFKTVRLYFNEDGVQRGKSATTLFWKIPYVIKPTKNGESWDSMKQRFDAILALVNTF